MEPRSARVVELADTKDYQRLIDGETQSHGMKAGRVYLLPGQCCGEHSTQTREETLVFLSGQGTLHIGPHGRHAVGHGRIAYIPPQTLHNVENSGTEPLVYIFCVAPAPGVS